LQFDGQLVLGSPPDNSTDDEAGIPLLGATRPMGFPKVMDWTLDLRDGRSHGPRIKTWGIFFPPFGKSLGESKRNEQELLLYPLSAGNDARLILASYRGVEMSPS
jgi:hypothetical protein